MSSSPKPVRIGNAQAFWGDRTNAAAEMLALEPELDYLTLDYLAEVSMSILAIQRERDPNLGYAREFVEVIRSLAPYWSSGGRCRVITNAGGLNPQACADACATVLAESGCRSQKIGIVSGDDVLELLRAASDRSSPNFHNLDTGAQLCEVGDRLVTANAYLGAAPIVEALAAGADIVITGRTADPSLVVAPCIHHFEWDENDFNRLAGATVAGHLIECGAQVTGGISTDWLNISESKPIGFPIVEVSEDGSCIVTKPRDTGGCVTELTVKEQLLYEISDPARYLSPDVAVSFLTLTVHDLSNNRVRVYGATGTQSPATFKVSATFRDGFRAAGTLTIVGRNAQAKARRVGALVLQRVRDAGFATRDTIVETITGVVGCDQKESSRRGIEESLLRVAIEAESRSAVERFSRELMPYITAGPQGTTGYAEGRPRIHEVFRYWPCLIPRADVVPQIQLIASKGANNGNTKSTFSPLAHTTKSAAQTIPALQSPFSTSTETPVNLYDIAVARSGDKGTSANIGIIARSERWWPFLRHWLSAKLVSEYFATWGVDSVDRYELPNLGALNFVLNGVLRRSLRTDAQGKALGQILLEMPLPEEFK